MRHLAKTLGLTAAIVVMSGLMALSGAQADTVLPFLDTTLVQPYIGTGPVSNSGITASDGVTYKGNEYVDVIGSSLYNTYQVQVGWNDSAKSVQFTIYTNYPQAGDSPSLPADLWLKDSNNILYGFAMTTHITNSNTFTAGQLYSGAVFLNANEQAPWKDGGWIYGGAYSNSGNFPVPVNGLSPTLLSAGNAMTTSSSLSWVENPDTGTTGTYKVVVDLGAVNTGGNFNQLSFFWGTGNCANDAIFAANVSASTSQTPVPVPASALLLGTGLVGLAFLTRRRRQES